MKKIIKLIIFSVVLGLVSSSCFAASTNLSKAKPFYNLAERAYNAKNYTEAISYAKQCLKVKADDLNALEILGNSYAAINNNDDAIQVYKKIIISEPNNTEVLNSLGQLYLNENDFQNALAEYHQVTTIDKGNKIAKENIEKIQRQAQENALKSFAASIFTRSFPAPNKVHRLIKIDKGVSTSYNTSMEKILDLVWNHTNGKVILNTIAIRHVQIKIVGTGIKPSVSQEEVSIDYSPSEANAGDTYKMFYTTIIIPANYIDNVLDTKQTAHNRIYSLAAIVTELTQGFMYVKEPRNADSIDQELGLSIIGYDDASRILTGEYLTKDQTNFYSYIALQDILSSGKTNLPITNGFNKKAIKYGLRIRFPEENTLANIKAIYNDLLSEGKIKPVASLTTK